MTRSFSWIVAVIRAIFILACVIMGAIWAQNFQGPTSNVPGWIWITGGAFAGGVVATVLVVLLAFITQEIYERLAPAFVAIALALAVGYVAAQYVLLYLPDSDATTQVYITVTLVLIFGFVGIFLGLTRASNWEELVTKVQEQQKSNRHPGAPKLVDTSVVIDGRIADICDSGFLEGTLLVPRFVLQELQHIADSSEVLRRAKGRRGLDILKRLQDGESKVPLEIIEDDPEDVREVDGKLVKLARQRGAKILTNDFNLNKVASIEGVEVLNVNDLANAMKPAVVPDERMQVKIIKEGKEPGQGVGYLDDGTMVVVDGARDHVGRSIAVVVTSVLQTAAGRMIFTRFAG